MPFTQETLDFLQDNKYNNSKAWFDEHKQQYKDLVVAPLAEFVIALEPAIHAIDAYMLCEPKVDKSISRIHRDLRFSPDKTRYREVQWCVFTREKKLYNGYPAYYFEISPYGFRYGCGYYTASAESVNKYRDMILKKDKAFEKAREFFENQNDFTLYGDACKRSKFPEQPENIRRWLDRKNVGLERGREDMGLLFSERLADEISAEFIRIKPVYDFLIAVELKA